MVDPVRSLLESLSATQISEVPSNEVQDTDVLKRRVDAPNNLREEERLRARQTEEQLDALRSSLSEAEVHIAELQAKNRALEEEKRGLAALLATTKKELMKAQILARQRIPHQRDDHPDPYK